MRNAPAGGQVWSGGSHPSGSKGEQTPAEGPGHEGGGNRAPTRPGGALRSLRRGSPRVVELDTSGGRPSPRHPACLRGAGAASPDRISG